MSQKTMELKFVLPSLLNAPHLSEAYFCQTYLVLEIETLKENSCLILNFFSENSCTRLSQSQTLNILRNLDFFVMALNWNDTYKESLQEKL